MGMLIMCEGYATEDDGAKAALDFSPAFNRNNYAPLAFVSPGAPSCPPARARLFAAAP
jgi:hypothetical protein